MTVYVRTYGHIPYNEKEILRYAGARERTPEVSALLSECISEYGKTSGKVCYTELELEIAGNTVSFGTIKTESRDLAKNLAGCSKVILFCAGTGMEIDRLIKKYSRISVAKSGMFQAIGTERVEAVCDRFNDEIKASASGRTRPRFSPGYGDLSIEVQRDIFAMLDCPRKIGVTLNESLLMSPSKSVTAIIGIE